MARRSPDDYSNSSDDRSRDLTAQFWGKSPSWRTTGTYRGSRRNGDRTGPVARTRRHGDPTGQIPVVPAVPAVEEPLIDPYDFGFDDVGYGPDQGTTGTRVDTRGRTSVPVPYRDLAEPVEQIELEANRAGESRDPVSTLAHRLGLGAVDPLLLRLGAIVMIGVLLVPLAMSFRPDSNKDSVRTEVISGSSGELPAPSESAVGGGVAGADVASSAVAAVTAADASSVVRSSDDTATAQTTSPPVAAVATEQPETTADVGDITESPSAGISASDSGSDAVEAVQSTQAMASTAGAAVAEEPPSSAPTVCQLPYTVGAGDYWIRIADAAGVSLGKLLRANLATVATPMYPGDDICLPEGATIPATPTVTTAAPPAAAPSTSPPPAAAPTTKATTTTSTTTTTTTTVPVPPAASRAEVEAMIREIWPDDLEDKALAIAWRESGYRSNIKNWCCYGLFQIHWSAHKSWLADIGVTSPAHLLDARTNIRAAYALYQRSGGWGPWGG